MGFLSGVGDMIGQMGRTLKRSWSTGKPMLLAAVAALALVAYFLATTDALQFNRSRRQWVDFSEGEGESGGWLVKFLVWFMFLGFFVLAAASID